MKEDKQQLILNVVNELGADFFKQMKEKFPQIDKEIQGAFIVTLASHVLANLIRILGTPVIPTLMDIGNSVLQEFRVEDNKGKLH